MLKKISCWGIKKLIINNIETKIRFPEERIKCRFLRVFTFFITNIASIPIDNKMKGIIPIKKTKVLFNFITDFLFF